VTKDSTEIFVNEGTITAVYHGKHVSVAQAFGPDWQAPPAVLTHADSFAHRPDEPAPAPAIPTAVAIYAPRSFQSRLCWAVTGALLAGFAAWAILR
jgi:hypothetical protein